MLQLRNYVDFVVSKDLWSNTKDITKMKDNFSVLEGKCALSNDLRTANLAWIIYSALYSMLISRISICPTKCEKNIYELPHCLNELAIYMPHWTANDS